MFGPVLSKLVAESLTSLYPVIVKYIKLDILYQVWNRLLVYFLISLIFIDWKFVSKNFLNINSIILSIINILHIYFSYKGFLALESGISYSIFYTYPIMILLMAGISWNYKNVSFISLAFIGVLLLNYSHYDNQKKSKEDSSKSEDLSKDSSEDLSKDSSRDSSRDSSEDLSKDSSEDLSKDSSKKITIGILYILLAAFTEALMYFYVRRIKTDNNWNQMFFSSYLGAFLLSLFLVVKKNNDSDNKELFANNLSKMTLLNIFIGSMGYYLRFYATYRLDPLFYSMLSYFGIFMAFIYGIIFNKEKITFSKTIGAACIIISNISLYIFTKV
jgi:drug/metabolite transporter (DMT)-like permease